VIADREAKRMRPFQGISGWLAVVLLTGCAASQTGEPTALRPAPDRILTAGDIHIAEEHLRAFGFDPGPVDGRFTAQTQAAVRAFQARYGLPVSGLLDRPTRAELQLGGTPGGGASGR
jgi:peptidoglycan hydrolase-like protein with peptidoglycan-binding domain